MQTSEKSHPEIRNSNEDAEANSETIKDEEDAHESSSMSQENTEKHPAGESNTTTQTLRLTDTSSVTTASASDETPTERRATVVFDDEPPSTTSTPIFSAGTAVPQQSHRPSARELELESLLKGSQLVFKRDYDRQLGEVVEQHATEGSRKDTMIAQLERTLALREEAVVKQANIIANNDEQILDRSRELRRQAMEGESNLRGELARVRLLKEKERFNSEKLEAALRNAESGVTLVQQRASAAEERRTDSDRRALMTLEDRERLQVQEQHVQGLNTIISTCEYSTKTCLVLENTQRRRLRRIVREVRILAEASEENHDFSSDDDYISDHHTNHTVHTKAEAADTQEVMEVLSGEQQHKDRYLETVRRCFAKVKSSRHAEEERHQLTELQYKEGLVQFQLSLSESIAAMSAVEEGWQSRWAAAEDRLRASEHKLETLKEFYSKSSRSSRAEAMVLDSLIEEHEEERTSMRRTISELESDVHHHRTVNRAAEAEEWKTKAETLAVELNQMKTERGTARAKVTVLQSEIKSHEGLVQSLNRNLKFEQQNVKDVQTSADLLQKDLRGQISKLEEEAAKVEQSGADLVTTIAHQKEEMGRLQGQVELLRSRNESLCQKWIEFGTEPPVGFGQRSRPSSARDTTVAANAPGVALSSSTAAVGGAASVEEEDPLSKKPLQFERMRFDQQPPNKEAQTLHDRIESLEQAVLVVKMERDTLKRQLDSAAAEISASEERRSNTLNRYLNLLSANDAAPRKEQNMLAQRFEIEQKEAHLEHRAEALAKKAFEVDKKANHVMRTLATYQARGGVNLMVGVGGTSSPGEGATLGGISGAKTHRSGSCKSTAPITPRGGDLQPQQLEGGANRTDRSLSLSSAMGGSSYLNGPMSKQVLQPIMTRPLTQPSLTSPNEGDDPHPQRAPIPVSYLPTIDRDYTRFQPPPNPNASGASNFV